MEISSSNISNQPGGTLPSTSDKQQDGIGTSSSVLKSRMERIILSVMNFTQNVLKTTSSLERNNERISNNLELQQISAIQDMSQEISLQSLAAQNISIDSSQQSEVALSSVLSAMKYSENLLRNILSEKRNEKQQRKQKSTEFNLQRSQENESYEICLNKQNLINNDDFQQPKSTLSVASSVSESSENLSKNIPSTERNKGDKIEQKSSEFTLQTINVMREIIHKICREVDRSSKYRNIFNVAPSQQSKSATRVISSGVISPEISLKHIPSTETKTISSVERKEEHQHEQKSPDFELHQINTVKDISRETSHEEEMSLNDRNRINNASSKQWETAASSISSANNSSEHVLNIILSTERNEEQQQEQKSSNMNKSDLALDQIDTVKDLSQETSSEQWETASNHISSATNSSEDILKTISSTEGNEEQQQEQKSSNMKKSDFELHQIDTVKEMSQETLEQWETASKSISSANNSYEVLNFFSLTKRNDEQQHGQKPSEFELQKTCTVNNISRRTFREREIPLHSRIIVNKPFSEQLKSASSSIISAINSSKNFLKIISSTERNDGQHRQKKISDGKVDVIKDISQKTSPEIEIFLSNNALTNKVCHQQPETTTNAISSVKKSSENLLVSIYSAERNGEQQLEKNSSDVELQQIDTVKNMSQETSSRREMSLNEQTSTKIVLSAQNSTDNTVTQHSESELSLQISIKHDGDEQTEDTSLNVQSSNEQVTAQQSKAAILPLSSNECVNTQQSDAALCSRNLNGNSAAEESEAVPGVRNIYQLAVAEVQEREDESEEDILIRLRSKRMTKDLTLFGELNILSFKDPDRMFLLSLMPALKKVRRDKIGEVKRKIIKIIGKNQSNHTM